MQKSTLSAPALETAAQQDSASPSEQVETIEDLRNSLENLNRINMAKGRPPVEVVY